MRTVHKCKFHNRRHDYTVCPDCGAEYCSDVWTVCPRTSWHWAHGATEGERAARALQSVSHTYASSETAYGRTVPASFTIKVF